jgi:hypothetical protein
MSKKNGQLPVGSFTIISDWISLLKLYGVAELKLGFLV